MKAPTLSVVIPTHNCLSYLPAALASVERQGLLDLEVIVVDDGSSDGTWDWLQAQRETTPWLRGLRLEGVGPARARNTAVDSARAELIAFLDADDLWYSGKLAAQIEFHLRQPEIVFSFTNYRFVGVDGADLGDCFSYWPWFKRRVLPHGGFDRLDRPFATLFAESVVGTSTVVARKNALQNANGFDESLQSAEDWDLWLRLAQWGPVGFGHAVLCDYLIRRSGSETMKAEARLHSLDVVMRRYEQEVSRHCPRALRYAEARLLTGRAELYRERRMRKEAFLAHIGSLKRAPSWRTLRSTMADALALIRPGKALA